MTGKDRAPDGDAFALEPTLIARSFSRASTTYDRAATLQQRVRAELLDRVRELARDPGIVLDLGAGTGHASRALKQLHRGARVIAADIAPGMLEQAKAQSRWFRRFDRVGADAARLPFAAGSIDLVFSNLMLQWCPDIDAVFGEVRRVLHPAGVFAFTTFGPGTLDELRESWAQADDAPHVNRFIDMHDIGEALTRAGLVEPVLDVERYTIRYDDVLTLMRDLKAIGAHNLVVGRTRALTGKRRLAAMTAAYESHRREGKLPASYEVVFGIGWGGTGRDTAGGDAGGGSTGGGNAGGGPREFAVPIDRIGRRSR